MLTSRSAAALTVQNVYLLLCCVLFLSCNIQTPSGRFSCRSNFNCPNLQFCHRADGLCHETPEPDAGVPLSGNTLPDGGAICPVDAARCSADGTHIERCAPGTSELTTESCDFGCQPGSSECAACVPGAVRCLERRPQLCGADGAAWQDNGNDCSVDCVDGECPICNAGDTPRCHESHVEECADEGHWQRVTQCEGPHPVCLRGKCLVCAPGATHCDGTTFEQCNADGTSWTRAVRKDICGAACDPDDTRCEGHKSQRCGEDGMWREAVSTVGECDQVCVPNEHGCAGHTPRICNADGTAWTEEKVKSGECEATCEPNASECLGTKQRTCDQYGQWSMPVVEPDKCGAACIPANVRCLEKVSQVCNQDGSGWLDQPPSAGTCDCNKPEPSGFGENCGSCGGKVQCDGTCSVTTPADFGQNCGSCGGTMRCDGSCSVATPSNLGTACGSCGGKFQCDGSCSVATPSNLGTACGGCGGKFLCDDSCDVATPSNLGTACGSCGGKFQCDGSCDVATPANLNEACGSCGGVVVCGGTCSIATPGDFGQACGECGGTIACNGSCRNPQIIGRQCGLSRTCCEQDKCGRCTQCFAQCP